MSKEQIAIIPVAGAGTRLRPFTYTQPTALIPVAGKPIISYIIDDLKSNGIEKFIFIVGYFGDKIVDFVNENHTDIQSEFVLQQNRKGLGHAIFLAREFISLEQELIIVLGDSIVEVSQDFYTHRFSTIAVKKVKDPTNFGVVEIDEDNKIISFKEKPKFPKSNFALVGMYRILELKLFFEILEEYNKEDKITDGEIQLTEVLNDMLLEQIAFHPTIAEQWLDVGNGEVLLDANAIMLQKHSGYIDTTAVIENSVIVNPVHIEKNCVVKNAIIGPNVTLGKHTSIEDSILENGIIGSYSKIQKMKLQDFVIGSDSTLKGASQTISVGDNTEIDFGK